MRIPNPLARAMNWLPWLRPRRWQDETSLRLPGVEIRLRRWSALPVPHEVSVIVPRMEVRIKRDPSGGEEMELILSSITVAHSPRPEPAGAGRASRVDGRRDRC